MNYYVYILTNIGNRVLYTGVTNNLERRLAEHRIGIPGSFTTRYHVEKLVYYEVTECTEAAIAREKQIKAGSRGKKIKLINESNPGWRDLSEDWG